MTKPLRANKGKGNNPERDLWQTPKKLFDALNNQYDFMIDCCALSHNSKCIKYFDKFEDVEFIHGNINCWMNPPFSKAKQMIEHFFNIVSNGVIIFRSDNMETKLWQDIILKNATWIFIPKGRVNYEGMEGNGSVFPSALIGYYVEPPKKLEGTILYLSKKTREMK